jgi:hypothetical protein
MNRLFRAAIPVLLAFGLVGCAEMFTQNLFITLGLQQPPTPPTLADLQALETGEAISLLKDRFSSKSSIQAMSGTSTEAAAARDEIGTFLLEVIVDAQASEDPAAVITLQQAAILYGYLYVEATGASEVVNNVFAVIDPAVGEIGTFEAMVEAILPESFFDESGELSLDPDNAPENRAFFDQIIEGLDLAYDAYKILGQSLIDAAQAAGFAAAGAGFAPQSILSDLLADENWGAIAQNALVAYSIDITKLDTALTPGQGLYDYLTGDSGAIDVCNFDPANEPELVAILEQAGLEGLVDLLGNFSCG